MTEREDLSFGEILSLGVVQVTNRDKTMHRHVLCYVQTPELITSHLLL